MAITAMMVCLIVAMPMRTVIVMVLAAMYPIVQQKAAQQLAIIPTAMYSTAVMPTVAATATVPVQEQVIMDNGRVLDNAQNKSSNRRIR